MSQSGKAFRQALYAAAQALYADVRDTTDAPPTVVLGRPTNHQPNIIVAVGLSSQETITRPTHGTGRSRERQIELSVTISVFIPSSENDQINASDQCDDMVDQLENYLRAGENNRLGGACRDSFVSAIDGPTPDVVYAPQSSNATGRVSEAVVTVTGFVRY